jgi:hypothetical protein
MQKMQNWIDKYIGTWDLRPFAQVKYIGICHTAFPAQPSQDSGQEQTLEQVCDQVDSWHKNRFGVDKCISYHYMIAKNGDIAQCNTLESNSYTVGNNRAYTICICLDGNFEFQQPTTAQLQSLEDLTRELGTNHPEFPASMADIYGDNELNYAGVGASDGSNPTACPGKNLMPFVIELRTTGQISSLKIPQKMETQPNQLIDPRLIKALSNPYYSNLYKDRNIDLALADISDRDDEIEELKNKVEEFSKIIGIPAPKTVNVTNLNNSMPQNQPQQVFDKPPVTWQGKDQQSSNTIGFVDKIPFGSIWAVFASSTWSYLYTFVIFAGQNKFSFDITKYDTPTNFLIALGGAVFGFIFHKTDLKAIDDFIKTKLIKK